MLNLSHMPNLSHMLNLSHMPNLSHMLNLTFNQMIEVSHTIILGSWLHWRSRALEAVCSKGQERNVSERPAPNVTRAPRITNR